MLNEEEIKRRFDKGNFDVFKKYGGDVEAGYKEFQERFGKDAISALGPDETLYRLFGTAENDSLDYWLQYKTDYFGSGNHDIWQGYLYKEKGKWTYSRARQRKKVVTEEEAKGIASYIRDRYVEFFEAVESLIASGDLLSESGYRELEGRGKKIFGKKYRDYDIANLYERVWFKKYISMLYPNYFMYSFSGDWVSYIFGQAGIKQDSSWYVNSFRFSDLARRLEISTVHLYWVLYRRYQENREEPTGKSEEAATGESVSMETKKGGCNIILYGVPGSGKSYLASREYANDESKTETIVFHPDYTYADFVGQILPVLDGAGVTYRFVPGPFTRILAKASNDPSSQYWLKIEEINRGNAPAIFGDIFQLLDRNEDGESEYGIGNPDIANVVYGDKGKERKIKIPSNLSIIATMNTSDQNVFPLDTAFQRRWWMRLVPNVFKENDPLKQATVVDTKVTWETFLETINRRFLTLNATMVSSEDKRLGVHFVGRDDLRDEHRFSEKVLKYLWDDAFKFNRTAIFDKEFKSLDSVVQRFCGEKEGGRLAIFVEDLQRDLGRNESSSGTSKE